MKKPAVLVLEDGSVVQDRIPRETMSAAALVKVTESIFLDGAISRNIKDKKTSYSQIGILYRRQCWSVKASYQEDEDDRRIGFSIQLNGLGGYSYGSAM